MGSRVAEGAVDGGGLPGVVLDGLGKRGHCNSRWLWLLVYLFVGLPSRYSEV